MMTEQELATKRAELLAQRDDAHKRIARGALALLGVPLVAIVVIVLFFRFASLFPVAIGALYTALAGPLGVASIVVGIADLRSIKRQLGVLPQLPEARLLD
jgi:hypothetical protein